VWTSTGSETIVCARVSLFTNVTRLHALMRVSVWATPAGPMTIVASSGVGADGPDSHPRTSATLPQKSGMVKRGRLIGIANIVHRQLSGVKARRRMPWSGRSVAIIAVPVPFIEES
jgi:hypothetical protein